MIWSVSTLLMGSGIMRLSKFLNGFRSVTPVVEKLVAEPFLGSGLQEPRGNDLVGIDVVDGQRNHAALEILERLHSSVLTSVTTPVKARAAAVSGLARKVRPPAP